ncbi:MAG: UDP-N-acetylmuramoyl-tripeptide--D-alanyl-D-alanine ligase [Vicinamibacterales bacterium]
MNVLDLSLGWVAEAVGGRLRSGRADSRVGAVSIDSRTLEPGDFFVALRGERFDGHGFLADAFSQGAAAALVETGVAVPALPAEAGVVEAADTTRALQDLAHAVRTASGARVVAITGSAGKTTTKDALAEMLSTRFVVVKNKGNLNNHIGLPLSLMQLREGADIAVMELGMNHPGEIGRLVAIAEPDVRVWTNVGDAHLGFFESADAVADAKAEILEGAAAETLLVCNADDRRIAARTGGFPGRVLTFGQSGDAWLRATDVASLGVNGMRATVSASGQSAVVETSLIGSGSLMNVLAAATAALSFGVSLTEVRDVAARLRPADRRGVVHRLHDDIALVDDSYNSSPSALRQSLDVLAAERTRPRRLAVLGEMLELGVHAERLHAECGVAAVAAGVSLLVVVGGAAADAMAEAALAAGMPPSDVMRFSDSTVAAAEVPALVRAGDVVLVKGSRGLMMDRVVDAVVAEHG